MNIDSQCALATE